jgi:hypothetical protein
MNSYFSNIRGRIGFGKREYKSRSARVRMKPKPVVFQLQFVMMDTRSPLLNCSSHYIYYPSSSRSSMYALLRDQAHFAYRDKSASAVSSLNISSHTFVCTCFDSVMSSIGQNLEQNKSTCSHHTSKSHYSRLDFTILQIPPLALPPLHHSAIYQSPRPNPRAAPNNPLHAS